MTEPSKTPRTDAAMAVVYDRTINADCDAIRAAIEPIEVELTAARLSLSDVINIVGDETVKAAKLHTEAQRIMARNEAEFGAVYCALCALRDRISAITRGRT